VRHARFPRVRRLRRGYHCKQVDAFLAGVEASLIGQLPPIAPSDIRRAGFELVRHGYDIGAVDSHLDSLEERVLALSGGVSGRRRRAVSASDEQLLRDQLDAPYMRRFSRASILRRGYNVDDVDEFLDRVTAALSGDAEVTVEQSREVSFRPKRGGYDENAVDETLDHIVEVLLIKRRAAQKGASAPRTDVETADPGS
jgi:DivIVA domain-containing protein